MLFRLQDIDEDEDQRRFKAARAGRGMCRPSMPAVLPSDTLLSLRRHSFLATQDPIGEEATTPEEPVSPEHYPPSPHLETEVTESGIRNVPESKPKSKRLSLVSTFFNKLTRLTKHRNSCEAAIPQRNETKKDKKGGRSIISSIKRARKTTRKHRKTSVVLLEDVFQENYQYLRVKAPTEVAQLELIQLENLLRFPEEVARNLIDQEFECFQQTAPLDYLHFAEGLLKGWDVASVETFQECQALKALMWRFSEVRPKHCSFLKWS